MREVECNEVFLIPNGRESLSVIQIATPLPNCSFLIKSQDTSSEEAEIDCGGELGVDGCSSRA